MKLIKKIIMRKMMMSMRKTDEYDEDEMMGMLLSSEILLN